MSIFSRWLKKSAPHSGAEEIPELPDQSQVVVVDGNIVLTSIRETDKHFLVQYMNDEEIFNNTLLIPNPYFESDAEWFIRFCRDSDREHQFRTNWTIRNAQTGALMGGIGRLVKYGTDSHKDEIGYWLARPYWNQGIMTRVVTAFCKYLFEEHHLVRIEACIYWFNEGSGRVLEKSGFSREGYLRKYTLKSGEYRDCILYAKTDDDPSVRPASADPLQ